MKPTQWTGMRKSFAFLSEYRFSMDNFFDYITNIKLSMDNLFENKVNRWISINNHLFDILSIKLSIEDDI